MKFLEEIQKKPEKTRNRLFWASLIISVCVIGFFWIRSLGNSLEKLKIESGKVEKSSGDFIEEVKKESLIPQFQEKIKGGLNKLEEFLKSEEFKKSLEDSKNNGK